jgi:uncharacterized protein with FMN-binding domain
MSIKQRLTGKRISGSLITLSSAAIFAIYAAGYEQTKAAADRFAEQSAQRMASVPVAAAFEQAVAALPVEPASLNRAPETSSVSPVAPSTNSVPPLAAETNPSAAVNEVIASETLDLPPAKPVEAAPVIEPAAPPLSPPPSPPPPPAAPAPAPAPPAVHQNQYKDGMYSGWGTSRHGNIEATVVIQDGRIASAEISQCRTRYPCSWVSQLPGQVVSRQAPNVDYVSGATQSVNAYYSAVVEALSKAK